MNSANRKYVRNNYNRMSVTEMSNNLRVERYLIKSYMQSKGLVRSIYRGSGKKKPSVVIAKGCFNYEDKKSYRLW